MYPEVFSTDEAIKQHNQGLILFSFFYESDDDGDSFVEDCLECCEYQQRFTEYLCILALL